MSELPGTDERPRCPWPGDDPLYRAYHDHEWGVPVHDDAALFEALTLEGAQAGLSWLTILRKREGYRRAFLGFDPARVARLNARSVERLLRDPGIVRHRGKIESTLANARRLCEVREEHGSFDAYLWRFFDDAPRRSHFTRMSQVPAQTPESQALCRDLGQRGFRFVGPTTCYAFMQAVGLVDDHLKSCFRHHARGGG